MNQEVKVVFGQYTAQRAITARGQLNADAAKALNDAIAYDPIFVIEGVQIEDIEFSKDYIRSVEARMQAEVAVQQRQQELAQERIKAEIAVTQATGRANSIRAEARRRKPMPRRCAAMPRSAPSRPRATRSPPIRTWSR